MKVVGGKGLRPRSDGSHVAKIETILIFSPHRDVHVHEDSMHKRTPSFSVVLIHIHVHVHVKRKHFTGQ